MGTSSFLQGFPCQNLIEKFGALLWAAMRLILFGREMKCNELRVNVERQHFVQLLLPWNWMSGGACSQRLTTVR